MHMAPGHLMEGESVLDKCVTCQMDLQSAMETDALLLQVRGCGTIFQLI